MVVVSRDRNRQNEADHTLLDLAGSRACLLAKREPWNVSLYSGRTDDYLHIITCMFDYRTSWARSLRRSGHITHAWTRSRRPVSSPQKRGSASRPWECNAGPMIATKSTCNTRAEVYLNVNEQREGNADDERLRRSSRRQWAQGKTRQEQGVGRWITMGSKQDAGNGRGERNGGGATSEEGHRLNKERRKRERPGKIKGVFGIERNW